jgi:hypothetical protein
MPSTLLVGLIALEAIPAAQSMIRMVLTHSLSLAWTYDGLCLVNNVARVAAPANATA